MIRSLLELVDYMQINTYEPLTFYFTLFLVSAVTHGSVHIRPFKLFPTLHINRLKQHAHRSTASFGGIGWPLEHILKRPHSLSALPARA